MNDKEKILSQYFTNIDKSIYALKQNVSPQLGAAIASRCSRSANSFREIFFEFYKTEDLDSVIDKSYEGNKTNLGADEKAASFLQRVFLSYGDESVGEMASALVFIENISPITAKIIESMRRMCFIEVSTRYVDFRLKFQDKYRYITPFELEGELKSKYENIADTIFDKYNEWYPKIYDYVKNNNEIGDTSEKAWLSAVHARTCDILREILPFGISVNIAVSGNGRDWSELVNKMLSHELLEVQKTGELLREELTKIIPNIMEKTHGKYRELSHMYLNEIETIQKSFDSQSLVNRNLKKLSGKYTTEKELKVKILEISSSYLEKLCTGFLFNNFEGNFLDMVRFLKKNPQKVQTILDRIIENRKSRFDKIPEGFEQARIKVEMFGPLSAWKDLQRHRRLSQIISPFYINQGFYVAPEIIRMNLLKEYSFLMQEVFEFIDEMSKKYPDKKGALEYLVPHGANVRWIMDMDIAEAVYMIELRSSAGGHMTYRQLMQIFFKELEKYNSYLAKLCKFVDMDFYYLGRRESFNKVVTKGGNID